MKAWHQPCKSPSINRRKIYHWRFGLMKKTVFKQVLSTVLGYMNPLDILGQHITWLQFFCCRCMCLDRVAVSHGHAGPPSAPSLPNTCPITSHHHHHQTGRCVGGSWPLPLYRLLFRDTGVGTISLDKHSPSGVRLVSLKKPLSTYHCRLTTKCFRF